VAGLRRSELLIQDLLWLVKRKAHSVLI